MGWFSKKDWNVIAIIFERKDLYRVNGNRGKGADAVKARDGARSHSRTILWAVFDQNGGHIEGDFGPGQNLVPKEVLSRLKRDLPKLTTVRRVLSKLETGQLDKASLGLEWNGYPKAVETPGDTDVS